MNHLTMSQFANKFDLRDAQERQLLASVREDLMRAIGSTKRLSVAGIAVRKAIRRVEKRQRELMN